MDSSGYIGIGVCFGILAGCSGAVAANGGGSLAWFIAVVLAVISQLTVFIGCIGFGVKVGIRDSGVMRP